MNQKTFRVKQVNTSDLSPIKTNELLVGILKNASEDDSVSKAELLSILSAFLCHINALHTDTMKKLKEFE